MEREAPRRMRLTLEDRDAYFAAATGGTRDGAGDGDGEGDEAGHIRTISPETVRARARHLVKGIRLVCEQLGIEPTVDGVPVAFPEGTEITDEDRARGGAGRRELEGSSRGGAAKRGQRGRQKGSPTRRRRGSSRAKKSTQKRGLENGRGDAGCRGPSPTRTPSPC